MFSKVKLTALELAELFGKKISSPQEERPPAISSAPCGPKGQHRACPTLVRRMGLTSAEVSLLTKPYADPLENTIY